MITETWTYTNKLHHCVDFDQHCQTDGTVIDIGWDEWESDVHTWISTLNKITFKIHKETGKSSNKLQMSKYTFDLLDIKYNSYYLGGKIGFYSVEIMDDIDDNKVVVLVNKGVKGNLIIQV